MFALPNFRFVTSAAIVLVVAASTASLAYSPVDDDPERNPGPGDQSAGVPYISDRLGPRDSLPAGSVLPDDFCIPDKLETCPEIEQPGFFARAAERAAALFDVSSWGAWASVQARQTEWSGPNESRSQVNLSFGIDRKFSDTFTVGVMGIATQQVFDENAITRSDTSNGLMAGPYFVFENAGGLTVDGRLLYGTESHDVETAGMASGSYDSTSTFVALRASTEIDRGNWLIYPSLELSNKQQEADAYTDTFVGAVAAATTSESFATLGVLAQYEGLDAMDGALTPYAGVQAHMNLDGSSPFATAHIGAWAATDGGARFNMEYVLGAIGLDGVNDNRLSLGLEIPF